MHFKGIIRNVENSVTLTCPAQSFPTPSFRLVFFVCIFKKKHTLYYYSEPIGGSKPQISEDSQLKRLSRHENQIMAFVCPAQGFPQPSFRLKFVSSNNIEQCLDLLFFKTTHHPSSRTELVNWLDQHCNICCFLINLEPIGSTIPKFSTIDSNVKRDSSASIALICPAQGYPSPAFRYFTPFNLYLEKVLLLICRTNW